MQRTDPSPSDALGLPTTPNNLYTVKALSFTPPSGPRAVLKPADAGTSLLGAFGDAPVASVDRSGSVQLNSADWSLEWWIAAEDKLHTPSTVPSVRQARLGAGPVIQTSLRVPGGDIIQRTWAIKQAVGTAVAIEFENTTATPVGLTLAVRPFDLAGSPSQPTVILGSDRLEVGDVTLWLSSEARDTVPELNGIIVPLPHKAVVRVLLVTADVNWSSDRPLPSAAEAQKGWDALVTGGSRVVLPEDRMTDLFDQTRGRLSLSTHDLVDRVEAVNETAGNELAALCLGGFGNEAVDTLRALLADRWHPPRLKRNDPRGPAASLLDGLGWAIAMYAPDWSTEFLPAATSLALAVSKKGTPEQVKQAHAGLSRISVAAGDREAAAGLDPSFGLGSSGPFASLADLSAHAQTASESGSWGLDDVDAAASALRSLRGLLIRESWDDTQPVLDLFPDFPTAWRGGSVELHSLPTVFGSVSAAIRWHGYRPALLWEVDRADHCPVPVRVRCSAFDPDWSTTDRKGETLLAGTPETLPDAPAEGQSFS